MNIKLFFSLSIISGALVKILAINIRCIVCSLKVSDGALFGLDTLQRLLASSPLRHLFYI